MINKYKDKISLKFNTAQLERIIIALINNGYNKKFAGNVRRLFNIIDSNTNLGVEKEVRVYLIKQISDIIIENNIEEKGSILEFLDTDGKYYNDSIEILNELYNETIPENELYLLDKTISDQLKYTAVIEKSTKLTDMLVDIQNENYDNLGNAVRKIRI